MKPEIRVGGSWRTITRGEMYRGGSWRTLTRGEIYKGGAWHPLFMFVSPFSISISPSPLFGSSSATPVSGGPLIATPSGGLAPYTYSWTGDPALTFTSPLSASTLVRAAVGLGDTFDGFASCTATDSLGQEASDSAEVILTRTSGHTIPI